MTGPKLNRKEALAVVVEAEMAGELGRYLHRGFQCRIMKNGVVLGRFPDGAWVPYATRRDDITLEEWLAEATKALENAPDWVKVQELPTIAQVADWMLDPSGMCPTPTGYIVAWDGKGPDGSPSWLVALGLGHVSMLFR